MLTPAEELGLSGLNLAGRVRSALQKTPEPELLQLLARIRDESLRRHVIYLRDGQAEAVPMLACPVTALPDQLAYIHFLSVTLQNALQRLPELYMRDYAVREVLRLQPSEEQWLWDCWGPSQYKSHCSSLGCKRSTSRTA